MNTVLRGPSLGRKGLWSLLAFCAYFVMTTIIITYERFTLMNSVNEMDSVQHWEERQVRLNITVAHTIQSVNEYYFSPDVEAAARVLAVEIEAILPNLSKQAETYAILTDDVQALQALDLLLWQAPSRTVIADLRTILHRLVTDLDLVTGNIRTRKQELLANYRDTYNRVTLEWLLLLIIAVGIFGGIGLTFFRRLAKDVDTVHARAIDIVRGYRGRLLEITRGDEIGALMEAVNVMQKELRERETQLELGRQQQFHKEKMAAVGNLAAAVAHEINNPLSAIVGIAECIEDQRSLRECQRNGGTCQPELILEQARRVMAITRQISEFSVPQSPEPELVDLNGLVRSTCSFVSFDRRFRSIVMEQRLDAGLPAVFAVADQLVQVLMNLLINAADAIQDAQRSAGRIDIETAAQDGEIRIVVRDNGAGIPPEIMDKIFTEHFTTKPPGRGSGLGLALCRSLIEKAGGRIVVASQLGLGTEVTVKLPMTAATHSKQ